MSHKPTLPKPWCWFCAYTEKDITRKHHFLILGATRKRALLSFRAYNDSNYSKGLLRNLRFDAGVSCDFSDGDLAYVIVSFCIARFNLWIMLGESVWDFEEERPVWEKGKQ